MKLLNPRKVSSKLTMTEPEHLATHEGMAHFAGTGPAGRTCRECIHWDKGNRNNGWLQPAPCKEFARLSKSKRRSRHAVPDDAAACKYFEINHNAPKRFEG